MTKMWNKYTISFHGRHTKNIRQRKWVGKCRESCWIGVRDRKTCAISNHNIIYVIIRFVKWEIVQIRSDMMRCSTIKQPIRIGRGVNGCNMGLRTPGSQRTRFPLVIGSRRMRFPLVIGSRRMRFPLVTRTGGGYIFRCCWEKQDITTQYALKHYTTGSDRGMAEGWDVHPSWLEYSPQRVLVKSSRRIMRCDFYCYLK